MIGDMIEAVGIDGSGSMWVRPATTTFPHIYLEAMEVGWDEGRRCLYSPKPREWSYADWFKQIISAVRQQGVMLTLGTTTTWFSIDDALRKQIEEESVGWA